MPARTIKVVIETKGTAKATGSLKKIQLGARNVGSAVSIARRELKKLKQQQKETAKSANKLWFIQKRLTASYLAGNIGARAISAAVSNLAQTFKTGLGAAVDFEFTMVKISAISSVVGDDLQSLENTIRDIAKVSPKTGTQVAQAALEMSKMGLAGKDLENSLEGVVGLSVALDEEVSTVGQTMVSVKNVFQKDASELSNIADKMFTTLGNSALNLEKFSTAFAFAGSSAKMAGVSFEELSAMMGVLADNGIKASTIGTQLRQVFTRLDDPTSKVSKAIGQQSIQSKGLAGTLRALIPILNNSGDAKAFFGQRAIAVANILTKNIGKIEELTTKTEEMQKKTEDASKALGDTMYGEAKKLTSAWEDLNTEAAKFYSPAAKTGLSVMTTLLKGVQTALSGGGDFSQQANILSLMNEINKQGGKPFVDPQEDDRRNQSTQRSAIAEIEAANAAKLASDIAKERQIKIDGLIEEIGLIKGINELEKLRKERLGKIVDFSKKIVEFESKLKIAKSLESEEAEKLILEEIVKLINERKSLESKAASASEKVSREREKTLKLELKLLKELDDATEKFFRKKAKEDEKKRKATDAVSKFTSETGKMKTLDEKKKELADEFQSILNMEGITGEQRIEMRDALLKRIKQLEFNHAIQISEIYRSSISTLMGAFQGLGQVQTENAVKRAQAEGKSEAEINRIRKKGFEQQKKYQYLNTLMSTASGVARALADYPFPMSAIIGGIVGTAGAVQAATISQQQFASGFDGTISQPTNILVGEEGAEDVMIKPRAKQGANSGGSQPITVVVQGDINGEEQFINRLRHGMEEIDRRSM